MQRAEGVELGRREDLVGKVALAGHSRQPENPRQSLAHAQPCGQGQRLQHRKTPLEEELLLGHLAQHPVQVQVHRV